MAEYLPYLPLFTVLQHGRHHHCYFNPTGLSEYALLDESENQFLSFNNFKLKFDVKCNYVQYNGLLSAIPCQWKDRLRVLEPQEAIPHQVVIEKLTCKAFCNALICLRNLSLPTADKRLTECLYDLNQRRIIYSLLIRITKEIKPAIFQYKIIHNILFTNRLLHKMKKTNSPDDYPFCINTDHTILHLFVKCPQVFAFWSEFLIWYN